MTSAQTIDAAFDGLPSAVLETIDARDLATMKIAGAPFVVDHLLPESALVLWTGESGSGKTALALHTAVAIALGKPVGNRFATHAAGGPVLYVNGELQTGLLKSCVLAALSGHGAYWSDLPPGALVFEGADGMSTIRFRVDRADDEQRGRFETTVDRLQPKLIVLDTQRSLFDLDEKEAMQVRNEFTWLRQLAARYGCCILVLHHLRKQNAVSNNSRERVSGSGDLVASVDVHIQAKATGGHALHALYFDKTRHARGAYKSGVECAVEASFEPPDDNGDAGRSAFTIGAPEGEAADITGESAAQRDILARLESEGPLTRNQIGASNSGTMKKAFYVLADRRRIVKTGQKIGRSDLWHLRSAATLFSEPVQGDEDHLGPDDDERAENTVAAGFQPVQGDEDHLGPQAVSRQTRHGAGPPSFGGDLPQSRQGERTGPNGPNPLGGTASKRTGSRSPHSMVCAACARSAIVWLSSGLCDECAELGARS